MKNSNYNDDEFYKIYEYPDYSVIEPNDGKYEYCLFFFAGFNENAIKYIYIFKLFLESTKEKYKLKIIVPFLPFFDNYPLKYAPPFLKPGGYYAWYSFKEIKENKFEYIFNKEKDKHIIDLINKEINKLKTSERIIFGGFSMGGRYFLEILNTMKIKTKFNIIFKTGIHIYENKMKNLNSVEANLFNENKFYLYYSTAENVITFKIGINSIKFIKDNFKNVEIKFDNGNKHVLDFMALTFFETILNKNLIIKNKF
jgi:predicted esterase